jgi:hypothetical protein
LRDCTSSMQRVPQEARSQKNQKDGALTSKAA